MQFMINHSMINLSFIVLRTNNKNDSIEQLKVLIFLMNCQFSGNFIGGIGIADGGELDLL